jgi:hypothetical protein
MSLAILMAILLLSGCQSLRLYNEGRDKQGQDAKTAWNAVDLTSIITTDRANLKKLLDAELDVQDKLAASIRNYEAKVIVGKPLEEGLIPRIKDRLITVAGSADKIKEAQLRLIPFRRLQVRYASFNDEFKMKGISPPTCNAVANGKIPPQVTKWEESAEPQKPAGGKQPARMKGEGLKLVKRLADTCQEGPTNIYEKVYKGMGGDIAVALAQVGQDTKELEDAEKTAKPLAYSYKTAVSEYEKVQKEGSSTPDLKAKLTSAIDNVRKQVDNLEKAQNAFALQFISQEKVDAIDKLVDIINKANSDGKLPDDASEGAKTFVVIQNLAEEAKKSLDDAKRPLAIPIILNRNAAQLNLEAANREIAILKSRVELSKQIVDALYDQATRYHQALLAINSMNRNNHDAIYKASGVTAFTSAGTSDDREKVTLAAIYYLDGVYRLDARRYKLEYSRIATFHEVSLAYSEVNVKQWNSLIGSSVEQVAASAAGGIKSETIVSLLNTIGIFYIGHGVNK